MALKALIVDDEQAIVNLVRHHLEKEGLSCIEAYEGETALQLARTERPDLIVLDLMLPGIDGLEICRLLRRDRTLANMAIIMLTAKAEEVDRVVGLGDGGGRLPRQAVFPQRVGGPDQSGVAAGARFSNRQRQANRDA